MNSSPIRTRFSSGLSTPSSRAKNRSSASTWISGTWKWPRNVPTTCAASSFRSRPWSTKTHVSWSPTALWTSSAATAESTPPLKAQSTGSDPTGGRRGDRVAVRHPRRLLLRQAGEERALVHPNLGLAELGDARPVDAAGEVLRHQLHPVADAERGDAELVDPGVDLWRTVGIHRRR